MQNRRNQSKIRQWYAEYISDLTMHIFWCVVLLMLCLAGWVGYSWFEMQAYRRVTGQSVSLSDAMFLRLGVQACIDVPKFGEP